MIDAPVDQFVPFEDFKAMALESTKQSLRPWLAQRMNPNAKGKRGFLASAAEQDGAPNIIRNKEQPDVPAVYSAEDPEDFIEIYGLLLGRLEEVEEEEEVEEKPKKKKKAQPKKKKAPKEEPEEEEPEEAEEEPEEAPKKKKSTSKSKAKKSSTEKLISDIEGELAERLTTVESAVEGLTKRVKTMEKTSKARAELLKLLGDI